MDQDGEGETAKRAEEGYERGIGLIPSAKAGGGRSNDELRGEI